MTAEMTSCSKDHMACEAKSVYYLDFSEQFVDTCYWRAVTKTIDVRMGDVFFGVKLSWGTQSLALARLCCLG